MKKLLILMVVLLIAINALSEETIHVVFIDRHVNKPVVCSSDQAPYKVSRFLKEAIVLAMDIREYQEGMCGSQGMCDCIGLIMGTMYELGHEHYSVHGSNYFARYQTDDLHMIEDGSTLAAGQIVFKVRKPTSKMYDLPRRYRRNGPDATEDFNDYYHVGIVLSTDPLKILSCSKAANGIAIDHKIGTWKYVGYIRGIDYSDNDAIDHRHEQTVEILPSL